MPPGPHGVVRRPLEPLGSVYAAGEEWSARSADDRPIERGTPVRVVAVDGLTRRSSNPSRITVTGLSAIGGHVEVPSWRAIAAFLVVVLLVIVYLSIRVVQQYEKMVVFRLGQDERADGPRSGPAVPDPDHRSAGQGRRPRAVHRGPEPDDDHQGQRADQRRLPDLLADQPIRSRASSTSSNFPGALQGVATTTLRAVIGDILLDEVLSKREQINEVLRVKLDEVTERWGGKVTTVEIREITPPRDVQDAMNRQLSAERTRRAVITESEGSRQAAINVAEGQKQAEILKAEGDRQAAILRAEGFSEALTRIYGAASGVDAEDDGAPVPRGAQGARREPRRRSSSSRPSSPGSSSRSPASSSRGMGAGRAAAPAGSRSLDPAAGRRRGG